MSPTRPTDRAEAIDGLTPVYGELVRLVDAGVAPAAIAVRLDVTPEALPALVEIAEAKLARLLEEDPS